LAKVSRKELLKKQDEFLTFTEKMSRWIGRNLRRLLWTSLGAAITIAVIFALVSYKRGQQHEGAKALGQAMTLYIQSRTQPGSEQTAQARQSLEEVATRFDNTESGLLAAFCHAAILLDERDYPAAQALLQDITDTYHSKMPAEIEVMVYGMLGQSLEGETKFTEAGDAFAKAASFSGPASRPLWLLEQARVLQAADPAAAVALYKEVNATSQQPFLRFNAANNLVKLGVNLELPLAE
jgi:predicted negative regulator of RcsB-dependent stress response